MNSDNTSSLQAGGCGCTPDQPAISSHSISLQRLDAARAQVNAMLAAKLKNGKCLLEDSVVHCFDRGFGVGSWAISKNRLTFAASGVVDNVPARASVVFDTGFFDSARKGKDQDILWVDFEINEPVPQSYRVPFRGVGVLRDPSNDNLLRCQGFELAIDLIADVKDIAKVIACVLACVGLFCAAFCAPFCLAIIACIACLGTCVGANLPQFLICVTACGVAVDGVGGAVA